MGYSRVYFEDDKEFSVELIGMLGIGWDCKRYIAHFISKFS